MNVAAREAFLETRRRYLGGTDITAVIGVSPWASPLSVYLDKTGAAEPCDETLAMRRGLALERFIADEFTRANPGLVCYKPRQVIRTDWGFPAGAQIDRMVARVAHPRTPIAVLEAKTAFRGGFAVWDAEAGELPDHYYVQVQWQLAVSGLQMAYAAADVGDSDALRILPIEADPRVIERLIDAGRRFWTEHVEAGVPPLPDGSERDGSALAHMWPETIPDPPVELTDVESGNLMGDYLAHSLKAKEHAEKAEQAKQRLQALMGEHETAIVGRMWRLSWKQQIRKTIDTKALRSAHPSIAEEFTRTSESRVFRFKEITE